MYQTISTRLAGRISHLSGILSALIGTVVLIGWQLDSALLKSIHPDLVSMKANTALGFILAGISLWLRSCEAQNPDHKAAYIADFSAVAVAIIGSATLLEYISGINFGIDQLLFREPMGTVGTLAPGRMAPSTAICFFLLGVIFTVKPKSTRALNFAQAMTIMVLVAAIISVLGYIYKAPNISGLGRWTIMAVHTALTFLTLSIGTLYLWPQKGVVRLMSSGGISGRMTRRLLPVAILVPSLFGFLKLAGEQYGLFENHFGAILVALGNIIVFSLFIVWSAKSIEKHESERKLADEALLSLKDRLQDQNEELQVNEEELRCQNDELITAEAMVRAQVNEYETSQKSLKEREESLHRQNNLFSSLLRILPIGVFMVEAPSGKPLVANEAAYNLLGRGILPNTTKENLSDVYKAFKAGTREPYPPEEMPIILGMNGVTSHIDDMEVERPDGTKTLLEIYGAPVTDNDGNIWASLVSFVDITDRKRAEAAIKNRILSLTQPMESGAIAFNELFNIDDVQRLQDEFAKATGVASIITDPDGIPLTAPSNFTRLCNDIIRKSEKGCANCFKSDAALGRFNPDGPTIQLCLSGGLWDAGASITVGGQHIANWLIGQVRDETQTEEKMAAYAREIGVDEAFFLAAFREVPAMPHGQFEHTAQTLFTLATQLSTTAYNNVQQARFINERKQSEEQLLSLTQRLQLATSSAHLGIWDWNVKENTMVWDDRMFELYGITRESFPNSIDAWMNGLHPEDKEAALAECQMALSGEREFDTEFRVLHPDGTVKHIRGKALVKRGADGNAERMIGINYDNTAAKHAESEKHKLESQLQQAQKMESVGRLAGGVAHDFNNMLAVIMGHAELGLMKIEPDNPLFNDLKEISKTAERSAELTRQLLTFARKQTVAPKVLDLNETVSGMLKMLQRLIGENLHLTWQPAANLWQTKIDPSQIDQILANLCVNARDAINDTGRITIETENCTIDADYCTNNQEAVPGDYVRLSVSDDGTGMDREILAHIFEPFYTTKEMGKGTGLGLATVYGAVKQNNGFICIYSEPDQGTTFSIYLPRDATDKNSQSVVEGPAATLPRGQETILLVEDEPAILNIASVMLEKQGYTVLKADTPGKAVELAREHHGEIHLLMTDVIMPEMNGRDLAKNILTMYPHLKRLFMSGYTADVIAHHGVLDEGVYFIQKPFSLPNMAAMVREVLDAS